MAVVSFDNSYYSQIGPVPISSLGHKGSRTGRRAAAAMLAMLSGEARGSHQGQVKTVYGGGMLL